MEASPSKDKDKEKKRKRKSEVPDVDGDVSMAVDEEDEADDWRPSPEEYKKMSSKEKRQLRNKISARNFRVRRKGEIISFVILLFVN